MACQFSPSLCTAAAKGDSAIVEKHLTGGCCNPFASQYFIDPDCDSPSQSAIVGFIRRKRGVVVGQKNGENSALVKPATPLQVALFYREEGVLFLLLNHFLKIANGNVCRCFDETAETIAAANGYSHLMDFYQYYDNINRDSFGTCWTEAMRHVCDLTTKLAKAQKSMVQLVREKEAAVQTKENALSEKDAALSERLLTYKTILDQKDDLIACLQNTLHEKDVIIEELQAQVSVVQQTFDQITGRSELELLQNLRWQLKCSNTEPAEVELLAVSAGQTPNEAGRPTSSDVATSSQLSSNATAAANTTVAISDCMHHHQAIEKKLECLKAYVNQCREKNMAQRGCSVSMVSTVEAQSAWTAAVVLPDLRRACGLELNKDALRVFDYGSDLGHSLESIIEMLGEHAEKNVEFRDVAKALQTSAMAIRDRLRQGEISCETAVALLIMVVHQFERVLTAEPAGLALAEIEDRIARLEAKITQCSTEKAKCEEVASVYGVERELNRQMDLQRRMLDHVREKLNIIRRKAEELGGLSSTDDMCSATMKELNTLAESRKQLSQQCARDCQALEAGITMRAPKAEALQEEFLAGDAAFRKALAENDMGQTEQWHLIGEAFERLMTLQTSRNNLVKKRIECIMNLKRARAENDLFLWAAKQHCDRLRTVEKKCQVSGEICEIVKHVIVQGQSKMNEWISRTQADVKDRTLTLHKEFYSRFREWYLTQGEYTHKKQMLLKEIKTKMLESQEMKRAALQRLDSGAEQLGEMLTKLDQQRHELEDIQIPKLQEIADGALPLFEDTKEFFTAQGIPFTHPDVDLRKANQDREREIYELKVRKNLEQLKQSQQALADLEWAPKPEKLTGAPGGESQTVILESRLVRSTIPSAGNVSPPEKLLSITSSGSFSASGSLTSVAMAQVPTSQKTPTTAELMESNRRLKRELQESFVIIPLEYLDPITLEIMLDPVTAADGHTYERCSIERFFQRKRVSPKTNEVLANLTLSPNCALKIAIEEWKLQQINFLRAQVEELVVPSPKRDPADPQDFPCPSTPVAVPASAPPTTTSAPLAESVITPTTTQNTPPTVNTDKVTNADEVPPPLVSGFPVGVTPSRPIVFQMEGSNSESVGRSSPTTEATTTQKSSPPEKLTQDEGEHWP